MRGVVGKESDFLQGVAVFLMGLIFLIWDGVKDENLNIIEVH